MEVRLVWRYKDSAELKSTIDVEGHKREITVVAFYEIDGVEVYIDRVEVPDNLSTVFDRLAVNAVKDRIKDEDN